MPTPLSQHFSLEELIFSQDAARQGIDNTPSDAIRQNLARIADILEEVRTLLGDQPMHVSSGYRCPELNTFVHGSKTSAH
ncbi:MAG: D-Ala-D-Ala carboxypeptidase family metallohydrolase, partial [Bacteroidota bacterium]